MANLKLNSVVRSKNMTVMQAKLIQVQGDEEEFDDLIGTKGKLQLIGPSSPHNWFHPEGSGDTLSLAVKRSVKKDDKIKVFTKYGNIFTFRQLIVPNKL